MLAHVSFGGDPKLTVSQTFLMRLWCTGAALGGLLKPVGFQLDTALCFLKFQAKPVWTECIYLGHENKNDDLGQHPKSTRSIRREK